ncbi:MAG: ImmA/IrrE family metallo-endopeptidase [Spirochaetaceae bacterium]|nr:ImmA/IrrE family metallo-endopeptidase [Spirochaetaceae bacterium]
MMKPKILKNDFDYESALEYIEILMEKHESKEINEEIELFTSLITNYEDEHFPVDLPDPIDAILFVMDQKGLMRKDLITIIGSQSKVSEVLNRKRPLSLSMMRNLHTELNIPAEILLQNKEKNMVPKKQFLYKNYPVAEMFKLGYFPSYNKIPQVKDYFEEIMSKLFSPFADRIPKPIYCKQSNRKSEPNMNALLVWQAHILQHTSFDKIDDFSVDSLDDSFIEELLSFSMLSNGPLLVKDYLQSVGIYFITEKHLPKTYLDGAVFKAPDDKPIVVLSLRNDRIDNFWFTLIHELGHVIKHLYRGPDNQAFFDDTYSSSKECISMVEQEANDFAMEHLIPSTKVKISELSDSSFWLPSKIVATAKEIRRSPALLAGRIRYETGDFSLFTEMLGAKGVKFLF